MNVNWWELEPSFKEIGYPGVGSAQQWSRWFESTWEKLIEAGMATCEKPLDGVRVRLRAFALCWLAHDFSEALLEEEARLFWMDWIEELHIDPPGLLMVAGEMGRLASIVARVEGQFECAKTYLKDCDSYFDEEARREFLAQAACYVAHQYRDEIVEFVNRDGGKAPPMIAELWAVAGNIEAEIEEVKRELEDQMENHTSRLRNETAIDSRHRLELEIEALRKLMTPEDVEEAAWNRLRESFYSRPLHLADDDSEQRLRAYGWAMDGFPIQNWGDPGYEEL